MAHALANLMGGDLFLKDTTEHGSQFCFLLHVTKNEILNQSPVI